MTISRSERDRIRRLLANRIGAGGAQLVRRAKKNPLYKFEGDLTADTELHEKITKCGFTIDDFWRAARNGATPEWWKP